MADKPTVTTTKEENDAALEAIVSKWSEAGISLNTAKAHLGKRPIAQYNYQAKLKRKANAKR